MPKENSQISKVNTYVDHVYVVTVKTFEDRISHIKKEMFKHNIQFTFFYEHFTPNLERDIQKKFRTEMKRGYKANVLQHIALWKESVAKGYKRILVFEDDVILHKNFTKHFIDLMESIRALNEDFIIFLGGSDTKVPEDFFLKKELIYPLPIATSEGLIMDIAGIKRRLKYIDRHKIHLPIDHLIAYIDKIDHAQSFWSRKSLTFQASIMGILKTKFDKHRLKHSKAFLRSRYYWNKFYRRQAKFFIIHIKYVIKNLIARITT